MAATICLLVICSGRRSSGGIGRVGGKTVLLGQYPSSSSMKLIRLRSSSLKRGRVLFRLEILEVVPVPSTAVVLPPWFLRRENQRRSRFSSSMLDLDKVLDWVQDSLHLSLIPEPRRNFGGFGMCSTEGTSGVLKSLQKETLVTEKKVDKVTHAPGGQTIMI